MKKNSKSWVGLVLRALIFSLVINASSLIEFWPFDGSSPVDFKDADEAVYLPAALNSASGLSYNAVYAEHRDAVSLLEIAELQPGAPVDLIVGYTGQLLNFSALELGLFLDLIVAALSYWAFSLFFGVWSKTPLAAEVSTIITLAAPWLFSVNNYLHFELSSIPFLGSPHFTGHSTLPVLRAVHTQCSYPLFGLLLYALARGVKTENRRFYAYAGILTALLGYIYIFAWSAAFVIVLGFVFCLSLFSPKWRNLNTWKCLVRDAVGFAVPFLIISIPAVYLSLKNGENLGKSAYDASLLGSMFYFSLETFILLCFLLVLSIILKNSHRIFRAPVCLMLAVVFSEFILMNLQPIFGIYLVPIHYTVFYLHPLFGGLCTLLLLNGVFEQPRFRRFTQAMSFVIVCLALFTPLVNLFPLEQDLELLELTRAVRKYTQQNSVLAMLPVKIFDSQPATSWQIRHQLNTLSALTGRPVLYQTWYTNGLLPIDEALKRELAAGCLFFGTPRLLEECSAKDRIYPKTAYFQHWLAVEAHRRQICSRAENLMPSYTVCRALREFPIDYVIWERAFPLVKPKWYSEVVSSVWKSSKNKYELLAFSLSRAKEMFCTEQK